MTWESLIGLIMFGAAVVTAFNNPARAHDKRVEGRSDNENTARWIADEAESGRSAHTTNTNLVGIRLVLDRIHMGVWLILALLVLYLLPVMGKAP